MKKAHLHIKIAGLLTFLTFLSGCGTTRQLPPPKKLMPDYDFAPPDMAAANSAKMKVAVLQPSFTQTFTYGSRSPFKQFRSSMARDIEELLTARGYIIKGPFEVYDYMTYSDKQECELGMFVDIDLNIEQVVGGWTVVAAQPRRGFNPATAGYQTYGGTLNLNGKVSIYIAETFTRQKLLVRSVPLPQIEVNVKADNTFQLGTTGIPMDDVGVHNPIANALVDFYSSALRQAWKLTETSELSHVYAQVPEIRKNAGFIKN